jgi:two-component system response regulator FixJ
MSGTDKVQAGDTVHIVDDDAAIRDSLCFLLCGAGFSVQSHDSAEAFLALAGGALGCVLTDVRMPGIDGLELQRRLREQGSGLPVIVMTGQGDIPLAVRAMREGAVDFLEKPFEEERLFDAIRRAQAESRRRSDLAGAAAAAAARLAKLTPREREVLDCLVAGLPNKAIANRLAASPRTIEVHRARVLEKLDAHSLPELVRLVLAAGGG